MGFMCFGSSKQDDPQARKNADIEKQLKVDQKKQAKEVKILLLGASYTGIQEQGRNADTRY
jgi:guanine nucleotide-binding protein subunit alpha